MKGTLGRSDVRPLLRRPRVCDGSRVVRRKIVTILLLFDPCWVTGTCPLPLRWTPYERVTFWYVFGVLLLIPLGIDVPSHSVWTTPTLIFDRMPWFTQLKLHFKVTSSVETSPYFLRDYGVLSPTKTC